MLIFYKELFFIYHLRGWSGGIFFSGGGGGGAEHMVLGGNEGG